MRDRAQLPVNRGGLHVIGRQVVWIHREPAGEGIHLGDMIAAVFGGCSCQLMLEPRSDPEARAPRRVRSGVPICYVSILRTIKNASPLSATEPPRVFRRLIYLSPATKTGAFCLCQYSSSNSTGGMSPIGSSSRRLLNQSTQSSVSNSTWSTLRQGPS